MTQLGTFTVRPEDSDAFARLSGDCNPLHLDPVAARRTQFGHTLIHGVCGTLMALDLLMRERQKNSELVSIRIKFSKPVTQDQELAVTQERNGNGIRMELFTGTLRCQIIDLQFSEMPATPLPQATLVTPDATEGRTCNTLTIDDIEDLSGSVDLQWDEKLATSLFPDAAQFLPREQLASLMACTQIVGMVCPGLHSVFAGLTLGFQPQYNGIDAEDNSKLQYRVTARDVRIDQVRLQVRNRYTEGSIEAFFRAPPAQQAGFEQILSQVAAGEFSHQNALVIGASRGLGEVITKVLAAGSANIMMTYAAGQEDAARVATQISTQRTVPVTCHYNVLESDPDRELLQFCTSVTHIYYLASPSIVKGDSKRWNEQLFNHYCDFYVHGLATLLETVSLHSPTDTELQIFIPSSVFLQEKTQGFNEYIAAKAAAEAYLHSAANTHRSWRTVAPRLPQLHTDQTSGVRGTDQHKTLAVIIEQLRATGGAFTTRQEH